MRDITVVRGAGAEVWDDQGRRYLDCVAGIGVASVGHANPAVAEAVARQARTLITCPGIFYNDQRAALMKKLVALAPEGLERVFLCNSGTEAVEASFKLARLATGRTKIVSTVRGFHGRTLGALSATFKKSYREPFKPLVPGFSFVPFNNAAKMRAAVDGETAAVVLEPVQGEGGIRPADAEYLAALRKICDTTGALLIADEAQTGFCRTGRMFACDRYGLRPDLMCVAKAVAGGVPMGAVLAGGRVPSALGRHGTTFGGNPAGLCGGAGGDFVHGRAPLGGEGRGLGAAVPRAPVRVRVRSGTEGAGGAPSRVDDRSGAAGTVSAVLGGVDETRCLGAARRCDGHSPAAASGDHRGAS